MSFSDSFDADLETSAEKLAGNWQKWTSFYWPGHEQPIDAERWCIVYTSNRDSGLLEQSNAAAIEKTMKTFPSSECQPQSASHWAVGHVDGWLVRVYHDDGRITDAFKALHEFACALADYPVLNDDDLGAREHEATLDNIEEVGRSMVRDDAPETWVTDVSSWLWEHASHEVESRDGNGGYPSEDGMRDALEALGYLAADDE